MKSIKVIGIPFAMLTLVVLFQNCSNQGQMSFAEAPSIEAAEAAEAPVAPSDQQEDSPATETPNPPATVVEEQQTCLPDGHIFTTGDSLPYIHYHKCDGEIETWRRMGESQCCSQKVSIQDIESYDYPTCPRFVGQMKCVGR